MGLRCARFKLRYKTFKDISRPTRETGGGGGGGTAQCGKCEAPMKWNLKTLNQGLKRNEEPLPVHLFVPLSEYHPLG